MSTLAKFRHLYEVLLRFDAAGNLAGAHAQYLNGITEDGVITQATPGDALPLSLVDAADKVTLAKVLGEALNPVIAAKEAAEAAAAEAVVDKEAAIQEADAKVAEADAKVAEADARAAEANAAAADALAKVEAVAGLVAVKEQLDAKDAIIQDLMAQMAPIK